MSILRRDNLNEINLKSLPGVKFGLGKSDPFLFVGIQLAFIAVTLYLIAYGIFVGNDEGISIILLLSLSYVFVLTTLRIVKLFESSKRSKFESILFWFAVVINKATFLITIIIGSIFVAANNFNYAPAIEAEETVRIIVNLIVNIFNV
ncbi:MAG: hypothetical protein ACK41P_01155 [Asticcacaulis sp.]